MAQAGMREPDPAAVFTLMLDPATQNAWTGDVLPIRIIKLLSDTEETNQAATTYDEPVAGELVIGMSKVEVAAEEEKVVEEE